MSGRVGGAQGPDATRLGFQRPQGQKLGLFIPQADLGQGTGDQLGSSGGDGFERGLQVQPGADAAGKLVQDGHFLGPPALIGVQASVLQGEGCLVGQDAEQFLIGRRKGVELGTFGVEDAQHPVLDLDGDGQFGDGVKAGKHVARVIPHIGHIDGLAAADGRHGDPLVAVQGQPRSDGILHPSPPGNEVQFPACPIHQQQIGVLKLEDPDGNVQDRFGNLLGIAQEDQLLAQIV